MRALSTLSEAYRLTVPCITHTLRRSPLPRVTTAQVKSNPYSAQSSSIASMRKAVTSVLAREGYKNAIWAGLTGPFACGEQDESDEVHMVVVWHPAHGAGWHPHNDPLAPDLDEELKEALGRYVYVNDVVPGKTVDMMDIKGILASRTLYGSEKVGLIVKLRKYARQTLEDGITLLNGVCKKIEETEALAGKTEFEEIKASKEARQAIQDHVNTIFHALDIQRQTNTLRKLLYEDVVAPVAEIRDDLKQKSAEPKSDQYDSTYWQTLWQIVSHDEGSTNSLKRLHQLLQNWVVPDLQGPLELSEKVQRFAREEEDPTYTFDDFPQSNDRTVQRPMRIDSD